MMTALKCIDTSDTIAWLQLFFSISFDATFFFYSRTKKIFHFI